MGLLARVKVMFRGRSARHRSDLRAAVAPTSLARPRTAAPNALNPRRPALPIGDIPQPPMIRPAQVYHVPANAELVWRTDQAAEHLPPKTLPGRRGDSDTTVIFPLSQPPRRER